MYDWLGEALSGSGHVVTASRRLARSIVTEYDARQRESGKRAWMSPRVYSWRDWLTTLLADADGDSELPVRINTHQSRVLWERCLRREINDPLLNVTLLVGQARDAWARLHEFGVTLDECRASAIGRDQQLFARAAETYLSVLERENWIDDALMPALVARQARAGKISPRSRVTMAGFDRTSPQVDQLLQALSEAGSACRQIGNDWRPDGVVQVFDNQSAELRAAGRWARESLLEKPGRRIAIVVTNLERDSGRCWRLVREGFCPGWQWAGPRYQDAVNISYGRPLSAYPACQVALVLLRWLAGELSSMELSLVLRSPTLGRGESGGRSRLELYLRRNPDRRWTPAMASREFAARSENAEVQEWLARLDAFVEFRSGLPDRSGPAIWGEIFDKALTIFGWPGETPLDSAEFQLVNRWRELLNELARLELVSSDLAAGEALGRVAGMAAETIFQPEADGSLVELLGPLEAAGMEFDQLWISGLGSGEWPPQGRPLALLARDLQRQHDMPDADPADTLEYSRRVLSRLLASARTSVCSYARSLDDSEQTGTSLLAENRLVAVPPVADPGWHAASITTAMSPVIASEDPVPALRRGESVTGGASVLQWQKEEPFSAFAFGRLGIGLLQPITVGLAQNLRGSLIHAALHRLYGNLPSSAEIRDLDAYAAEKAAAAAFRSAHRNADPVLAALLRLEERRVIRLLAAVLELDKGRSPFTVSAVEESVSASIEEVPLRLRIDRVDTLETGDIMVLDYKTGMRRRFLGGDGLPGDIQLVVYACALEGRISDLALVNVDSRGIEVSGAGKTLTPDMEWEPALAEWSRGVRRLAREFRDGDVRLYGPHNLQSSRSLGLLSRIREKRDAA